MISPLKGDRTPEEGMKQTHGRPDDDDDDHDDGKYTACKKATETHFLHGLQCFFSPFISDIFFQLSFHLYSIPIMLISFPIQGIP